MDCAEKSKVSVCAAVLENFIFLSLFCGKYIFPSTQEQLRSAFADLS